MIGSISLQTTTNLMIYNFANHHKSYVAQFLNFISNFTMTDAEFKRPSKQQNEMNDVYRKVLSSQSWETLKFPITFYIN